MKKSILLLVTLALFSCNNLSKTNSSETVTEPETTETPTEMVEEEVDNTDISDISTKDFREFKVLDSENLTKDDIWSEINSDLDDFTFEDHERLKALVLEQDIPSIQSAIAAGKFSYEELTKFYLFRIREFDRENSNSLNSVISINPSVIEDAREADKQGVSDTNHPVFGMPILLKDNIDAEGMATTAGAVALKDNFTGDAFIVSQLKSKGALILGKANLSEWAYFFCGDCPSGYSAMGGQTLNPYGRRVFDTGGSSSGSAVSVAANFAVAAVGSETSGSILSPSAQNSVVGLKPTVGLLSRSGIVPISSTLDTAGPITKNVMDNAIVLDALFGQDESDLKSFIILWESNFYYPDLKEASLKGKRFGAPKRFMEDSLFVLALEDLKNQGAEIVEIDEMEMGLPNFIRLLNLDMKKDLPAYMANYANDSIKMQTVSDFVEYNTMDSLKTMPYGQRLFRGIVSDNGDNLFLERIKDTLKQNGKTYFNTPLRDLKLQGFLSINNRHAGFAAVAEYPAITVPMGYTNEGEPKGLTIISTRLREKQLLEWAYVYEQATKKRVPPANYD